MTNRTAVERTRAFGELVRSAPDLIPLLPWSKDFEKDKFLSPDFTSLEVLTFCGTSECRRCLLLESEAWF